MIKNFTPHQVNIIDNNNKCLAEFPSLGTIRVKSTQTLIGHATYEDQGDIQGIPVFDSSFEDITDKLPPVEDDTVYVVSRIVKNACPERNDFVVPNDVVRNQDGQIIGCQSFSR